MNAPASRLCATPPPPPHELLGSASSWPRLAAPAPSFVCGHNARAPALGPGQQSRLLEQGPTATMAACGAGEIHIDVNGNPSHLPPHRHLRPDSNRDHFATSSGSPSSGRELLTHEIVYTISPSMSRFFFGTVFAWGRRSHHRNCGQRAGRCPMLDCSSPSGCSPKSSAPPCPALLVGHGQP